MTSAEIQAVRLELDRAMRCGDDALALRLLQKIERERREQRQPVETPDLSRFDEFCSRGAPLEAGDVAECEACRRDHGAH